MNTYQFSANLIDGVKKPFSDFEGNVLLIVNTATKCGFAPQFKELEEIYQKYKEKNFVVLGFPSNQFMNQEPGENKEIAERCEINFGVTFPLFEKIDVKGPNAHPLYQYLTKEKRGLLTANIKWNFTKFLVNQNGDVVERYSPSTTPLKIEKDIKNLLELK